MKIKIESTDKIVNLNGQPCRVWEGETSSGIPLVAFVCRVAVPDGQPTEQFERELRRLSTRIQETGRKSGEKGILGFYDFLCDHSAAQTLRAAADQPEMANLIRPWRPSV